MSEIGHPRNPKWRVFTKVSDRMWVLCATFDGQVRFAPFYITSLRLCAPHRLLDAAMMSRTYRSYSEITAIPDRLRWLRHSKGLIQREAARIAGVSRSIYSAVECGVMTQLPEGMAEKLANYYGVPVTDFLDEFNRFLYDGHATRIRDYRRKLGLGRKAFCRQTGIPLSSLRSWEDGKKEISLKCWEMYFKGKA